MENGTVDSPPSHNSGKTPICLPSPLRDCRSIPI
jgi:hypothetical protein